MFCPNKWRSFEPFTCLNLYLHYRHDDAVTHPNCPKQSSVSEKAKRTHLVSFSVPTANICHPQSNLHCCLLFVKARGVLGCYYIALYRVRAEASTDGIDTFTDSKGPWAERDDRPDPSP